METMAQVRSTKEQAKERFLTYVRTLQFMKTRLKGEQDQFVFIPQREIETRFFIHPYHNRKQYLSELVLNGELEMRNIAPVKKNEHARYEYNALRAGALDIALLPSPDQSLIGHQSQIMREHLKRVSLKPCSPSTPYFDVFLKFKDEFIEHFFTVDAFAQRVHTPITNFHRTHRPNILIDGMRTVGLDVSTMQPLILGKVLHDQIGVNDFTDWTERGEDIYIILQKHLKLETRDQGKKRFFEITFAPPSNEFVKMFGDSNWTRWINWYKSKIERSNPRNEVKPHSNLSWLLQNKEVCIMRKVWQKLNEAKIVFLSVHDEIIVKEEDLHQAESIFRSILEKEFKFYQLNIKSAHVGMVSPACLPANSALDL